MPHTKSHKIGWNTLRNNKEQQKKQKEPIRKRQKIGPQKTIKY